MDFDNIFSQTWKEYRTNFSAILKFILIFIIIPSFVFLLINTSLILSNDNLRELILNNTKASSRPLFSDIPYYLLLGITSLISLALTVFVYAGLTSVSLKKNGYKFVDIVYSSKKNFWRYLTYSIVIIIFLTLLFILLIIPMIIFLIYWIFAAYILFDQDKGILESLKTSKKLVRGKWWKVFGYSLLFFLIIVAISIGIYLVSSILLMSYYIGNGFSSFLSGGPITSTFFVLRQITSFISQTISSIIVIPLTIIFFKNFYLKLKKSKK